MKSKLIEWLNLFNSESPVIVKNNCFYAIKKTAKGSNIEKISSFHIKPTKTIFVEGEGVFWEGSIITDSKKAAITISPESFTSANKFKKNVVEKSSLKNMVFTGDDAQVQHIKGFLSGFDTPDIRGVAVAGFHGDKFVSEEGALDKKGSVHTLTYINSNPTRCKIISHKIRNFVIFILILSIPLVFV